MATERLARKFCPLCGREYLRGRICKYDGAVLINKPQEGDPLLGTVLKGQYRVEKRIAAGGMSLIYEGTQLPIDRPVAIKVLLPELQPDTQFIQRFFREAKILGGLSHPNIVTLIDCSNTPDGTIYLVTELLKGRTLDKHVPLGKGMPFEQVVNLMGQLCSAVAAAHAENLIHRDLKPSNVFVLDSATPGAHVKLLDFGIAKPLKAESTQLTRAGTFVGTPGYIAPELLERVAEPTLQADIYSLGALLYLVAAGRPAFSGRSSESIIAKQLNQDPTRVDFVEIEKPEGLNDIILKAMHREASERFQSATDLNEALEECLADNAGTREWRTSSEDDTTVPVVRASGAPPTPTPIGFDADATEGVPAMAASQVMAQRPPRGRDLTVWAVVSMLIGLAAFLVWRLQMQASGTTQVQELSVAPASANPAPVRGVSETEIVLGMTGAFTGPLGEMGEAAQAGVIARFRELNERGGVLGRLLRLVALDDVYEPDQAQRNILELVGTRRVFAIVGTLGTRGAERALPITLANRTLFFAPFSGADLVRPQPPNRYVFHFRASYADEAEALVDHLVHRHGVTPERIAVFTTSDSFGDAGFRGVMAALQKYGVATGDVSRVGATPGDIQQITEAVASVRQNRNGIEAVISVATFQAAAPFLRALRDAEVTVPMGHLSFVGSQGLAAELKTLGRAYMDDVLISQVVPHPASDLLGVQRYRQSLATYFPELEPDFTSLEGYLAASVLIEGLARAPRDFTTNDLIAALESLQQIDLGIGQPVSYEAQNHQALDRVWLTELQNDGTLRTVVQSTAP